MTGAPMAERILAVEDSPTQGVLLVVHLEEAGFDVTLATSGEEALGCLEARPFDLVLSDVVMPGIDGYELCRQLKEIDRDVPVVLLTSLTDPIEIVRALEAGADNFLRKPYEPDQLVARLRTMLRHRELRVGGRANHGPEVLLRDKRFLVTAERQQILDLLVSSFEDLVDSNRQLRDREEALTAVEARLREQLAVTERERRRLGAVLGAAPHPMVIADALGAVTDVSDQLCALLGRPRDELIGTGIADLVSFVDASGRQLGPDEVAMDLAARSGQPCELGGSFDLFVELPSGQRLSVITSAAPVHDGSGDLVAVVGSLYEIGGLAAHDSVTKMPKQTLFADRVARALVDAASSSDVLAVTSIVVDRFAQLERRLGDLRAERLVAALADRLRRIVSPEDGPRWSARAEATSYFGDGVFAVAWSGLEDELEVVRHAQWLHAGLSGPPMTVDGEVLAMSVTVGLAVATPEQGAVDVVASAVVAGHDGSAEGGARLQIADDAINARATVFRRRTEELSRALDRRELVVHYQPEIDVHSGAPVGIEALVRWQHPTEGLLTPAEFLHVAADAGLLDDIAWYVLDEACLRAASLRATLPGGDRLVISVNVDASQLGDPHFVDRVAASLRAAGLDPSALVLEITEGGVVDHADLAAQRLQDLKALGVRIAIDDFGTGYASLQQLRSLPVDLLKIDRSFVDGMTTEADDAAIVAATVRLGRALGLETVAEGVESEDHLVQLRVLGCDLAQGFYWSPAVPADELERWWRARGWAQAPIDLRGGDAPDDASAPLDEVIAYLVHELRTPLTVLTGYAGLLEDAEGNGPEYVEAILRNVADLDRRLTTLADLRRAGHGALSLELTDLDAADLARTVVEDLRPQLAAHPVGLVATGQARCRADPSRLGQALMNLILNAAKFSEPDAPIEVEVGVSGDSVEIAVRDRGPGVPPHRRPELFRRFARLGSRHTGMGVGLYLVRAIARAHGGDARYEDAPGGGARFTVALPVRELSEPSVAPASR
ncbi:MAG: EAL domain-containing protein [Acidimicrobiia bacterium]|nr:EAL domain-containing protein [Acidimicrobiia bacterium]